MSVALNAESYVASAQIYLHCRLLRKPRRHPEVQAILRNLMRCIDLVPLEGPLYTAQDSLLGPAIAGVVAVREEDREIIRQQFIELLDGPRGNDTPVYRTLEDLWEWLDTELEEDDVDDRRPIAERRPWWETVVDRIMEKEGRLSLI
jgi:Fungal specific transcription factor domain